MAKRQSLLLSKLKNSHKFWWIALAVIVVALLGILILTRAVNGNTTTISGHKTSIEVDAAISLYADGKLNEAREKYEDIITEHPRDYVAWNGLGNVYRDLGQVNNAEDAYLTAIDINARFEPVYRNLLTLYAVWPNDEKAGKLESLRGIIEKAVQLNQSSLVVLDSAANYYTLIGETDKADDLRDRIEKL